jgi:hypothetical protein
MRSRPLRFIRLSSQLLTATALLFLGTHSWAQSTADQGNRNVQDNDRTARGLVAFDRFMDSNPDIAAQVRQKPWLLTNYDFLQSHPDLNAFLQARPQLRADISQNPDTFMRLENRLDQPDGKRDLTELDRFLDEHPDIAAQLRQKPWLVTNYDFLQSHSDLKTFLQNHPQLNSEIGQNPVAFLQEENLYDRPEGRRDESGFNQFMTSHREIAEQVRKNPSLLNDKDFVRNHPALQSFLQQNPGVRDEIRQNPNAFTRPEQPSGNHEVAMAGDADARMPYDADRRRDSDLRDRDTRGRDRDNNRENLAQFNKFLDSHREIAEQIRKNPSLVNDRDFVQNHPALQSYLQVNPGLRQDLRQDPNGFMQEEKTFQQNENGRDRDISHEHMAEFGGFLGGHSDIAKDVSRNPSIVKNHEYVQQHTELNAYLNAHPDVRDELMANPASFVKGAQQVSASGSTNGAASTTGSGTPATGSGTTNSSSAGTSTASPGSTHDPKPKQ